MNFQKTTSTPTKTVWANEKGLQVHIMGAKVLASKMLMSPQIDAVLAADKGGKTECQVGNCGLLL